MPHLIANYSSMSRSEKLSCKSVAFLYGIRVNECQDPSKTVTRGRRNWKGVIGIGDADSWLPNDTFAHKMSFKRLLAWPLDALTDPTRLQLLPLLHVNQNLFRTSKLFLSQLL